MSTQNDFRFSDLTPLQWICGTIVLSVGIIGLSTVFCFTVHYDYHYRLRRLEIWNQEDAKEKER